jgi:sensor histidine kinase regulating citrate/malate metabolism
VVAVGAGTVVGGSATKARKDDGDKNDATLALAGVAAGAGTVYAVVNERDKAKTQAELDSIRQEMDVVTVNVTNSNGSISQVRLQKQGIGYVGPKGEFYDHLPRSEELQPVYGI